MKKKHFVLRCDEIKLEGIVDLDGSEAGSSCSYASSSDAGIPHDCLKKDPLFWKKMRKIQPVTRLDVCLLFFTCFQ